MQTADRPRVLVIYVELEALKRSPLQQIRRVKLPYVDCIWNVMAHAQKLDFVFLRNGRVHLNRRGRQFSRLLTGDLCTSACRVCTVRANLCSAVMWRLLVTHSILLFLLHFSSRASPCAITFQLESTTQLVSASCTVLSAILNSTLHESCLA